MAGDTAVGASYSTPVAAIFIYNLIVGVGCLTLPHAFQAAGIVRFSHNLSGQYL
jgi:hypothetical protein